MIAYQCPCTLMECPHPDSPPCIFTRNSKAEFDAAEPGDTLREQCDALLCDGPLALVLERDR